MDKLKIDLYCGDCLEVMKIIPDGSVDMILCDLPYGITKNKWDIVIPLEEMWQCLDRICKPTAAKCFTASQPFSSMLCMSNLKEFRHEWIWKKNRGSNFANTVREPMREHETILVFSKGKWTYNRQMEERSEGGKARAKYKVNFTSQSSNYNKFKGIMGYQYAELRVPSSVQKFNVEVGLHPTQKPLALMEYLVKTYTNEGDTVLDFTMGSGTVGVACKKLNRNFIGIELDAKYYQVAQERIANTAV
ncbi:MAG: site-specific DNA-methyltransferase [Phascolarctobacterium sp.]|nr:site-specific DNA-methyltransferase [Phascolarctobacterium sp.]